MEGGVCRSWVALGKRSSFTEILEKKQHVLRPFASKSTTWELGPANHFCTKVSGRSPSSSLNQKDPSQPRARLSASPGGKCKCWTSRVEPSRVDSLSRARRCGFSKPSHT